MLKTIGGVILGYVVMVVCVFVLLTCAYFAMGADRAFKPAAYDVTPLWLAVWLVVSFGAAFAGGKVCAAFTKNPKATLALAGLVLILGLVSAIPVLMAPESAAQIRTGDVSNMQAMMSAKEPSWVAVLNPVIGVLGVLIGGRLKGSEKKA